MDWQALAIFAITLLSQSTVLKATIQCLNLKYFAILYSKGKLLIQLVIFKMKIINSTS